jgi:sugar lactone lactonase YvrE
MSAMKKMVRIVVAAVVLFVTGAGVMAGPIYVESIGSSGNHADHFMTPQGIAVDAAGDVYVADSGTGYVQKLTLSDGRLAFVWSSWSHGLDYPKFSIALGMAVDSGGNLYVGDTGPRVQKIAETAGSLSNVWTYTGTGGTGYYASGLAVDSASNVYVADKGNNRILKLGQSGGNASLTWSLGSIGIGAGQFQYPEGVAVDSGGNLYVLDTGNGRIQKFSQSGGGVAWEWSYGTQGSGAGQFANPSGIAVSTGGSVYVADTANNRVVKLTQAGGSLAYEWACGGDPAYPGGYLQSGTGDGQFFSPFDIAVDSVGNMYVADSSNNRIQRWFDSEAVAPGGTMSIDTIVVHHCCPK